MIGFENLSVERQTLIGHRVTRAICKKLQQEDIAAMYAFSYINATAHRQHNSQLGPMDFKQAVAVQENMLHHLLQKIQTKRDIFLSQIIIDILKEEGVTKPTGNVIIAVSLSIIQGAIA